jgi:two-component system nitrate/nitrite response regulator NarL
VAQDELSPARARSVLIVDDHAPFRAAARLLLERAGFEVVGESADAAGALAAADALRPAIVLVDIGLPDGDGFEVAERLAARDDAAAVILVSSREGAWSRNRLAGSPARGFISKGDLTGEAVAALVGGA